jgi:hypothetical protein
MGQGGSQSPWPRRDSRMLLLGLVGGACHSSQPRADAGRLAELDAKEAWGDELGRSLPPCSLVRLVEGSSPSKHT